MRRGSLVLPLLLIAIGTLLLLPNFIPDVPLLDWVARYWPFVLVVWGGLRLIEVLAWRAAGRPLPARGLSGGEWFLAFLVAIAGMSIHAARGFYSWLPESGITWGGLEVFGQSYDFPLSGEAATSASPRVVIEGFRGDARITGADVQAVTVTGRNTIRSMDKAGAERANQAASLEIAGDPNQPVIHTHQDRVSGGPRVETHLEITVPRGASIVARGRGGDFDLTNIDGGVEIDSEQANVRLENIGGQVRLNLRDSDLVRAVGLLQGLDLRGRGADIDLERIAGPVNVNGSFTGSVQMRALEMPLHWVGPQTEILLQALPGDLDLTLGDLNMSNARGPIRIDSRSKDIWLSGYTGPLDMTLGRGDVLLEATGAPLGRTSVRTNAGNLELALPRGARFDLVATTERGEVVNNYGDPLRAEENGRRGGSIRGSNGGPVIELHTGRGRVLVREGGSPAGGSIFPPVAPRAKQAETPPPAQPVFQ